MPEKRAGLFVEAKQGATVALMLGIARRFVVRADENLATRDSDVAVALLAELGDPLKILHAVRADLIAAGLKLNFAERVRQAALG